LSVCPRSQAPKSELYMAFWPPGIRKAELARRLGIPKTTVDRLFDLDHHTRLIRWKRLLRLSGSASRLRSATRRTRRQRSSKLSIAGARPRVPEIQLEWHPARSRSYHYVVKRCLLLILLFDSGAVWVCGARAFCSFPLTASGPDYVLQADAHTEDSSFAQPPARGRPMRPACAVCCPPSLIQPYDYVTGVWPAKHGIYSNTRSILLG